MSIEHSGEEIIIAYKNGNKEIFKELVDKYTSPIYNFTARLAGKENASDLTQDIFIKTWKHINSFDISKSSFKTWIFTIAKNTITDYLRKKKISNFTTLENAEGDFSTDDIRDEDLLPNEVFQKLEDAELLNNSIEKLSKEQKTVLILHYQEDITFYEIGKILNKPLNTVKSYHRRAILNLRKMSL